MGGDNDVSDLWAGRDRSVAALKAFGPPTLDELLKLVVGPDPTRVCSLAFINRMIEFAPLADNDLPSIIRSCRWQSLSLFLALEGPEVGRALKTPWTAWGGRLYTEIPIKPI